MYIYVDAQQPEQCHVDAAGRGDDRRPEGVVSYRLLNRRDAVACTVLADLALQANLGYKYVKENLGLH